MENAEEVKPDPPQPRHKIPGTDNLHVCGDGQVYQWDRRGFTRIETFPDLDGNRNYHVTLYGEHRIVPVEDLIRSAREVKKPYPQPKRDAKAYRAAADFLLEHYITGPVSFRSIKRVANRLIRMAEEIESRNPPLRTYAGNTRITKEFL